MPRFIYDGPLYTRAEALGFAISDLRRSRPPKRHKAARRFVDAQIALLEAAKARVEAQAEAAVLAIDWARPRDRDDPEVASGGADGIMGGTK